MSWNLQHRVRVWDLIYKFADKTIDKFTKKINDELTKKIKDEATKKNNDEFTQKINDEFTKKIKDKATKKINDKAANELAIKLSGISLSPYIVTSFLYISKYYKNSPQESGKYDNITVLFSSIFITTKQLNVPLNLENLITIFSELAESFTNEQFEFWGETSRQMTRKGDEMKYKQLVSHLMKAELDFLTFIGWDFVTSSPFGWFIELCNVLKCYHVNKKGAVNQFRDMRSVGLHDLVLFIVTSDDLEQYSEKCIAGASIQSGVEESPVDTFNGDPKSKDFWVNGLDDRLRDELIKDLDVNDMILLSKEIPKLEDEFMKTFQFSYSTNVSKLSIY